MLEAVLAWLQSMPPPSLKPLIQGLKQRESLASE